MSLYDKYVDELRHVDNPVVFFDVTAGGSFENLFWKLRFLHSYVYLWFHFRSGYWPNCHGAFLWRYTTNGWKFPVGWSLSLYWFFWKMSDSSKFLFTFENEYFSDNFARASTVVTAWLSVTRTVNSIVSSRISWCKEAILSMYVFQILVSAVSFSFERSIFKVSTFRPTVQECWASTAANSPMRISNWNTKCRACCRWLMRELVSFWRIFLDNQDW